MMQIFLSSSCHFSFGCPFPTSGLSVPPVIFNLLLIWLYKDEVSFTRMLTQHDWFIGYCLLSSEQYFSYIVHGNKYNTIYKNYIEIRDGWVNRTNNIWCHWKNWRGSSSWFEYPMLTNKDWQTIISRTQMYRVWVMVFNFNHISVMWWRSVL